MFDIRGFICFFILYTFPSFVSNVDAVGIRDGRCVKKADFPLRSAKEGGGTVMFPRNVRIIK